MQLAPSGRAITRRNHFQVVASHDEAHTQRCRATAGQHRFVQPLDQRQLCPRSAFEAPSL